MLFRSACERQFYVSAGNHTLNANVKLTLTGAGAERNIQYNGAGTDLFLLNANGASLTLGRNITLRGASAAGSRRVIGVFNGGSLTMLDGSKITGHTASSFFYTVTVGGATSVFTMKGGEISGNHHTGSESDATGGVYVQEHATFVMSGGKISGNTSAFNASSAADVMVSHLTQFTLSGNAEIGAIILHAYALHASVNITGFYGGKVERFHLYGYDANPNTVAGYWTDKTVIVGGSAANIAMFNAALGQFRTSGTATQNITGNIGGTANYRISGAGVLEQVP